MVNHTSAEQCDAIIHTFGDYDIFRNLGAAVMDNASANDKSLRLLSKQLRQQHSIEWDDKQRVRCFGHVLNLIVQAFIFGKEVSEEQLKDWQEENITTEQALERVQAEEDIIPTEFLPTQIPVRGKKRQAKVQVSPEPLQREGRPGRQRTPPATSHQEPIPGRQRPSPEPPQQESIKEKQTRERAERNRKIGSIGRLANLARHSRGSKKRRDYFLSKGNRL